jgi:enoyl-CoA hydratase/carnithine racemase
LSPDPCCCDRWAKRSAAAAHPDRCAASSSMWRHSARLRGQRHPAICPPAQMRAGTKILFGDMVLLSRAPSIPTIAAIDGHAWRRARTGLACDLRLCKARNVSLETDEVPRLSRRAVVCAAARLIGPTQRNKQMLFTGRNHHHRRALAVAVNGVVVEGRCRCRASRLTAVVV